MSLSKTASDDAHVGAGSSPGLLAAEQQLLDMGARKMWTRHGECDMCGFCCETIGRVTLQFPDVQDEEYARVRGITNGMKTLEVIDPCPQLDGQTKLCQIHPTRPKTCRDFPSNPAEVSGIPCTYWFTDADGRVIAGGTRSPHPQEV